MYSNIGITSRLLKNEVLRVIFLMCERRMQRSMGGDRHRRQGIGGHFASFSMLQIDSSRCRQNFRNANEVCGVLSCPWRS